MLTPPIWPRDYSTLLPDGSDFQSDHGECDRAPSDRRLRHRLQWRTTVRGTLACPHPRAVGNRRLWQLEPRADRLRPSADRRGLAGARCGAARNGADTGVPGAAASVVFGDGRQWSGAAGYAVLRPRQPMTAKTSLPFDSVTKVAIAALALRLVEQRRLGLDDRLCGGIRPGTATRARRCAICSGTRQAWATRPKRSGSA